MAKKDKPENIANPEFEFIEDDEPIEDDELAEVTGGKGFTLANETVIGGDNKIVK